MNIRHRPNGSIYAWEFEKDERAFSVKLDGQLVFNSIMHVLSAAVDGIGLAYVSEELAAPYLASVLASFIGRHAIASVIFRCQQRCQQMFAIVRDFAGQSGTLKTQKPAV